MRAYLALGGVYASKEDYKDAADVYDKAVARIPEARRATTGTSSTSAASPMSG